jgi:hypothetical protein
MHSSFFIYAIFSLWPPPFVAFGEEGSVFCLYAARSIRSAGNKSVFISPPSASGGADKFHLRLIFSVVNMLIEKCFCETVRVEFGYCIGFFAETDKFYGDV